jgi:hypothetical protein
MQTNLHLAKKDGSMSNNFKELEKRTIEGRVRSQEETKKKINSNIQFFGFVSSILDVYVPKVGSVLTAFNSSEDQKNKRKDKNKYPNQ